MRLLFERPQVPEGQSWTLLDRRLEGEIPFQWHCHREYELTLTTNSRGQRYVGDHLEAYDDGDLVLLGPNLPHTWASSGKVDGAAPHVALVMWFRPEWAEGLVAGFAEFSPLPGLLQRAARGLRFSEAASLAARPRIERLIGLPPPQRLLALVDVLMELAGDARARPLAGPAYRPQDFRQADRPRIERVLDHIHAHYQKRLAIDDLARVANLSASGFHRMFHRHMQMTVLDYVAQLRIGRACESLIATSRPIAHIAEEVGFDNLANFNRRFRALKQATPREFRRGFA